jgi:hypothetical protein
MNAGKLLELRQPDVHYDKGGHRRDIAAADVAIPPVHFLLRRPEELYNVFNPSAGKQRISTAAGACLMVKKAKVPAQRSS